MTLHIEIDKETENQLTAIAAMENTTLEQIVALYLRASLKERNDKLAILRAEVKKGLDQLDRGERIDGETFFKELSD